MIDTVENDRLTRVGPGTPGGTLLRRYWQPAALTEELKGDRPVVPVTLLGEDLVLFSNDDGSYGLIDRACPHRRADLAFGRVEDGGLRCTYHGWLFSNDGSCRETPAEPTGSTFCERVSTTAYPVVERNGIVWAYMGHGTPPPMPAFDAFEAPSTHVFAFKGMWDCNWLQAQEVGVDPAHASFLHRFLGEVDEEYGLQFRATLEDAELSTSQLMRDVANPDIAVEQTGFGFRLTTLRHHKNGFSHVRVTNGLFPNAIVIPMSEEMTIAQWHVPIDDRRCYWYSMFVSYGDPVDADVMRAQRIDAVELPDYRPKTGRWNNWGFDPEEQRTETYTGMGSDINVHDQWAVESQGQIHDRTKEHLSPSDVGIRAQRRMLLAAMDDPSEHTLVGLSKPSEVTGPGSIDAVARDGRYEEAWRHKEALRREQATWQPPPLSD